MSTDAAPATPPTETPKLHAETLWLEELSAFDSRKMADGSVVLLYTTTAGRRYAIPLKGAVLDATRKAVSPITVAGADQIPHNGHRA